MLRVTENKGFHITFKNGWTASVQFGRGNYCRNYSKLFGEDCTESPDAEIAAFNETEWYDFGDDTVKGNVTPDEVVAFLALIAALK